MSVAPFGQHLLSMTAISHAWRVSRDVVRARLAEAGVKAAAKRGPHPVYELADVVQAMTSSSSNDPDSMDPYRRQAWYRGEAEKVKLQVERGELLSRIEVESEFARVFGLFGRFCDTLPDLLEREGSATAAQLVRVETLIDGLREELADNIATTEVDGVAAEAD